MYLHITLYTITLHNILHACFGAVDITTASNKLYLLLSFQFFFVVVGTILANCFASAFLFLNNAFAQCTLTHTHTQLYISYSQYIFYLCLFLSFSHSFSSLNTLDIVFLWQKKDERKRICIGRFGIRKSQSTLQNIYFASHE